MTTTEMLKIHVYPHVDDEGRYTTLIRFGADHTIMLTSAEARAHADTWFDAILRADYDSGLARAQAANGHTGKSAVSRILHLIETRLPLNQHAIDPVRLEVHLAGGTYAPSLLVKVGTGFNGIMSLQQARDHASRILTHSIVTGLHNHHRAYLVDSGMSIQDAVAEIARMALLAMPDDVDLGETYSPTGPQL